VTLGQNSRQLLICTCLSDGVRRASDAGGASSQQRDGQIRLITFQGGPLITLQRDCVTPFKQSELEAGAASVKKSTILW